MIRQIADGRTDLVFEHIAAGRPAGAADAGGVTILKWCAYYGDVSAIRFLMSKGEALSSLGPELGLCSAAFHGHWRLCQFLLENGANVAWTDPMNGETALHSALCAPNRAATSLVVQVLLANGADPNAKTKPGVETDAFMRDARTKGETPLHRAAAFADEATIRSLVSAGAAVDAKDMHGDSPLSWASWHARPDAILRLLCYGKFSIHPQRSSMEISLLGKPR